MLQDEPDGRGAEGALPIEENNASTTPILFLSLHEQNAALGQSPLKSQITHFT